MTTDCYDLSISRAELSRLIPRLRAVPSAVAAGPAGLLRSVGACELLARDLAVLPPTGGQLERPGVLLRFSETPIPPAAWSWFLGQHRITGWGPLACLSISPDGAVAGDVLAPGDGWSSIDRIRFAGSGALGISLCGRDEDATDANAHDPRWQRPLGLFQPQAFKRLTKLTIAVIGAGGNGSRMALALARLGVRRLILVDPDRIEPHNLHTTAALPQDVGRFKIEVVGDQIRAILGGQAQLTLLSRSITRFDVIDFIRKADVLVSAVDNDGARLITTTVAALYTRALLDVGSGVVSGARMGGDIRLIYPGEGRCLCCWGGFARAEEIADVLEGVWPPAHAHRRGPAPLLSLNQLVVHLGVRLLEDMVREQLAASAWLRLEYDNGVPSLQNVEAVPRRPCRVCALAGAGDAGLSQLSALVAGIIEDQQSAASE